MSDGPKGEFPSDLSYKEYSGEFVWQIHNFSKLVDQFFEDSNPWRTKTSSPFVVQFGSVKACFALQLAFDNATKNIGLYMSKIGTDDFQCDIVLEAVDRHNKNITSHGFTRKFTSDEASWGFPEYLTKKILKTVIPNRLTADGALKVVCKITFERSEVVERPIGNYASPQLVNDLQKLLTNSVMSDFTILCGDEVFPCHKAILALRSDVFERMFENKSAKENTKNEVEITDCEPEILRAFLQFLYTDQLTDASQDHASYNSVDLLLLADKYNVLGLKKKCELALASKMDVKNAIELLTVASRISATILEPKAANFIFKNLDELVESDDWEEMAKTNPALLNDIFKFRSI